MAVCIWPMALITVEPQINSAWRTSVAQCKLWPTESGMHSLKLQISETMLLATSMVRSVAGHGLAWI